MANIRLTVGQAVVRFLAAQHTERDGIERPAFAGCFGIFGHGNVAGLGQALLEAELGAHGGLKYYQARNEQAMVHTAIAYARMKNRLSTFACTASIGPGSTNMLTAAALATISRLPVLLLPSDTFATRASGVVLQQLERFDGPEVTVNDAFRPLSRFFDRVSRPEQLAEALLGAMRVLFDPVETGAVTVAIPQDVQAEAFDWPEEFFDHRVWHVQRQRADSQVLARAADLIRASHRPLIVAGGGAIYSEATDALRALVEATAIPVSETQAGKGSLPYDHPQQLGAVGATGTAAANEVAAEADLVIGVGTRWSDFTTASRRAFLNPAVRFINLNVASFDTAKHAALPVVGDARASLEELGRLLDGYRCGSTYIRRNQELAARWDRVVEAAYQLGHGPLPAQSEVIGAVNTFSSPSDVVFCAAGSMPGDLHKLWRTRDVKGYHVEYGYSCMGYEIAGGIGAKMAAPEREIYVMVGDGSYLMLSSEIVTAVAEGIKVVIILVQNHGFASIGELSESLGSQRFGTRYRYRDAATGRLEGAKLPVDLAANAESLGATVMRVHGIEELNTALTKAREVIGTPVVIHIETDPLVPAPSSESWWDVPVAEVADLESTLEARAKYEDYKQAQRPLLGADFAESQKGQDD